MVLDRAPAAADLREDLDQDSVCTCKCGPGSHGPTGCRAGECLCPAGWDGLSDEDLQPDDLESEQTAERITAGLVASVRRRRLLDQEQRERRTAQDAARLPMAGQKK